MIAVLGHVRIFSVSFRIGLKKIESSLYRFLKLVFVTVKNAAFEN